MTNERFRTINEMVVAGLFVTMSLVGHAALSSLDTKFRLGQQSSGGPMIELQDAQHQPRAPQAGPSDPS